MLATKMSRRDKETIKAVSFCGTLLLFALSAVVLSFSSIDRVILGTELNGNGTVEYLCLGTSCEGLTNMDW
jgi:hypothetical protein|tara:strand:- start:1812 stop:2024 length:213 start_codon:yes stop_codon:yes gene_type:complete